MSSPPTIRHLLLSARHPLAGEPLAPSHLRFHRCIYLSLLEKKPGALDQAAPLRGWKLDPAFDTLQPPPGGALRALRGKPRNSIQVLIACHEDFRRNLDKVACRRSARRGEDALCLHYGFEPSGQASAGLARIERRPAHLEPVTAIRTCPSPSSPPRGAPTTPLCWRGSGRPWLRPPASCSNGGAKMPHARRPGGPVASAQKCATYGPLSVLARGGGCTAWSSMRRFGWRLSMRG